MSFFEPSLIESLGPYLFYIFLNSNLVIPHLSDFIELSGEFLPQIMMMFSKIKCQSYCSSVECTVCAGIIRLSFPRYFTCIDYSDNVFTGIQF